MRLIPAEFIVRLLGVTFVISAFVCGSAAHADLRRFTYSYEPSVLPKGWMEFEQWITAKVGRESGTYAKWDFREEIEFGLTERLTTAVYLNFRDVYSSGVGEGDDEDGMEFKGVSSEWKYLLWDGKVKPLGVLLYGEATYDGEEAELEAKLVLGKEFGPLALALNGIVEQEWEFEEGETGEEGILQLTGGASYKLNKHWAIGVEFLNHREYPEWEEEEHSAWFMGPNVHYHGEKWFLTATVMPQIGDRDLDEHEKIEARIIAGKMF